MATRKDELEAEALKLPASDRAELAQRLIESLEGPGAEDVEAEWIEEAERRYAEYRKGRVGTRGADQVFREAKARLE
jgi:putative addiction module component (TIGR02574 family)